MTEITKDGIDQFYRTLSSDNPRHILEYYQRLVKWRQKKREKLKNPINKRIGKSLAPVTIKQSQRELNHYDQYVKDYRCATKMLVVCGVFGNNKTHKGGIIIPKKKILSTSNLKSRI